jgi:hypothetical protein
MPDKYDELKLGINLTSQLYFPGSVPNFLRNSNVNSISGYLGLDNNTVLVKATDIKTSDGTPYYNLYSTAYNNTSYSRPINNGVLNLTSLADINCVGLLNDSANSQKFRKYMYNLYAWYDRCSSINFGIEGFVPKLPNNLSSGSMWTLLVATGSTRMALAFKEEDTDNPVMKYSQVQNPFVARRMLRLFIMLGNLYIAQTANLTGTYLNLENDCYQLLRATNVLVYGASLTDYQNTIGYNLNRIIIKRMNNYKKGQDNISKIDNIISYHKNNLKQSNLLLKDSTVAHRKQMVIEAIALASFISITSGAAAVVVYPMEQNSRYVGCLVVIALAIINAFVMNGLRAQGTSVVVESFTVTDDTIDEAVKYIHHTHTLANLLDTFRAVSNMNQSMTKEVNFYNDTSEQLLNANLKVRAVYNISYSKDVKFGALINLLTSLSFVIAGMLTLYVSSDSLVEKNPMIQKYIIVLGGVISTICFAIFTLEISTRVHTDPRKIYWGSPAKSILP